MSGIIVAFSKAEDAKTIRSVLLRSGFDVAATCTTGGSVLLAADRLSEGIIVCSWQLRDMVYRQIFDLTSPAFSMVLVASTRYVSEDLPEGICHLALPLRTNDLIDSIRMLEDAILVEKKKKKRKSGRSVFQQQLIDRAKALLMKKNGMSEEEAHRYLQKTSMENGTGLVETAGVLLSLMEEDE